MFKPGHEMSESVRAKISASLVGIKRSDETKKKMGIARRVENLSDATRAKYSAANRARGPISDETRKRLSDSHKGNTPSKENLKKRSASMKGKNMGPRSAEVCEKISLALVGRKYSPEMKLKMSQESTAWGNKYFLGHKHTAETKKILSISSKRFSGPLSSSWKGGVTPENKKIRKSIESRLWRESVFCRDNFTCQKCQERGGTLHPHHIRGFAENPDVRFAIDNGITLCKNCHKAFHNLYGNKGNDNAKLGCFLGGVVEAEREANL